MTGVEPFEVELVRRAALDVAKAGSETEPPPLRLSGDLDQSVFSLIKESVP